MTDDITRHHFELRKAVDVDATPEQVWDAIATGPGVDSWFMGRTEIEARPGGSASLTMAGGTEHSTVTAWEPVRRLAVKTGPEGEPGFMAIEYLVEARAGGSAVMRLVHSGIMGDGWETEFEAMQTGWDMYLHTLAAYLRHFPGRTAVPITGVRPGVGPLRATMDVVTSQLGLGDGAQLDAKVGLSAPGLAISGVVDYVDEAGILGLRTADGLYRFMHTGPLRGDVLFMTHHLFGEVDAPTCEAAWQAWADGLTIPGQPT